MSCPNATAPIDISLSKITGKCDYKCYFSFQYSNSSCIATNRGTYISLSYDKTSSPPVTYNNSKYSVEEIRLYIPSLHSYNNSKTDGELMVIHSSNTGANPLLVCIPIKSNGSSSTSALLFKTIVDTVANSAPADGETTTVSLKNFNLNTLVPKKPYFAYSATEPYQPCSTSVEYIVYAPLNASLDIMPETLTKLQSIIQSNPYDIKNGPSLFFNEKGPSVGGADGGEIYIDCQPVNASEEQVDVIVDNTGNMSFQDWLNNPAVKIAIGSLLFIVILYCINKMLGFINPTKGGGGGNILSEAGSFVGGKRLGKK